MEGTLFGEVDGGGEPKKSRSSRNRDLESQYCP